MRGCNALILAVCKADMDVDREGETTSRYC
jgi:hypothetical protein